MSYNHCIHRSSFDKFVHLFRILNDTETKQYFLMLRWYQEENKS